MLGKSEIWQNTIKGVALLMVFLGVFFAGGGGLFGGGFGGAAYHVGVLDGGVGFFNLGFERAEAVGDVDAVIAVVEA